MAPKRRSKNSRPPLTSAAADYYSDAGEAALFARWRAESERRHAHKMASGHEDAFGRDGFVLDAWDALANALIAGRLPSAKVARYFIEAARQLTAVADRHAKKSLRRSDAIEATLAALDLSNLVKGHRSALARSSPNRWRDHKIVHRVAVLVAEGWKLTAAYREVANEFGLEDARVVKLRLDDEARRYAGYVEDAMADGMTLDMACEEVDRELELAPGTARKSVARMKRSR